MKDFKQLFQKTHQTLKAFQGKVAALKTSHELAAVPLPHSSKEEKPAKNEIHISSGTMVKFVVITIALLLVTGFLYEIRDILVIFFVSLLFASALDPMVDSLERHRIPRALGVVIIYLISLLFLGIFVSNLVPILAHEIGQLASRIQEFVVNIATGKINLPTFMEGLRPGIKQLFNGIDISQISDYKDVLQGFANKLSEVAGNLLNVIGVVFNGVVNAILVLVITFMMSVDERGIDKFVLSLFPARYAHYITDKSNALKEKMGYWLRGQVILCVVVGLLVYIGFLIIGLFTQQVEYAATIAMVAGLTELIPYAGPFIAWLIAMPIMANQSFGLVIWMTVLMYVVQLLENNVIVPLVMNKAVGISPIFVMFGIMIGFSFLGILGIVLAVPVAAVVSIFIRDYAEKHK